MSNADELVSRYILRTFRSLPQSGVLYPRGWNAHLAECPETAVAEAEAEGCRFWDTGVTGMQFTAELACPHGARTEFEFGELGELPDILADMQRDEEAGMP